MKAAIGKIGMMQQVMSRLVHENRANVKWRDEQDAACQRGISRFGGLVAHSDCSLIISARPCFVYVQYTHISRHIIHFCALVSRQIVANLISIFNHLGACIG